MNCWTATAIGKSVRKQCMLICCIRFPLLFWWDCQWMCRATLSPDLWWGGRGVRWWSRTSSMGCSNSITNVIPWLDLAFYHSHRCVIKEKNRDFICSAPITNEKCVLKCSSIAVTNLKLCGEKYKMSPGHKSISWICRNPLDKLGVREWTNWGCN